MPKRCSTSSVDIGNRKHQRSALFASALALDHFGEHSEAIKRMEEPLRLFENP